MLTTSSFSTASVAAIAATIAVAALGARRWGRRSPPPAAGRAQDRQAEIEEEEELWAQLRGVMQPQPADQGLRRVGSGAELKVPAYRRLGAGWARQRRRTSTITGPYSSKTRVLVLGSGPPTGTPQLAHLLRGHGFEQRCAVCKEAAANVESSPNVRLPTSLLLQIKTPDGSRSSLLLDCGPAFKRQFLLAHDRLGTRTLDAVLLTQGDSHTLLGLNDLREVQHANGKDNRRAGNESADASLPVYGAADALARAQSGFPFLFPEPSAEQKKTLVGQLRRTEPVERRPGARVYLDLPFLPAHVVPVGALGAEGLVGYSLGRDDGCVVLLPSPELPQDSLDWLQKRRLSLLVLGGTETEADVRTALRVVNAVTPERAVLLGAGCTLRHEEVVECLAAEPAPCPVELAYDGMCVDVRLYNTEGFSAPASPNLQPVDLLKPVEDVSPSGSQDSTHTTSSTETSEHGEASARPVLAFLSPLIGGHDNGKANGYCAPCPNGVNGHMPEFTL